MLDSEDVLGSYQKEIDKFVKYPEDQARVYLALGLVSEAGEVADKLKKQIRDGEKGPDDVEVVAELGDVLFYLTQLTKEMNNRTLENIAIENWRKLDSRNRRNTISGSGDNR